MLKRIKELVLLSPTLIALIILFNTNSAFAGVTGKISGRVVDAQTGEAIAGANMILEGAEIGAATDTDGHYFIINIAPGFYTVVCNVIGYTTVRKTRVYVAADLTTRVDFELEVEVIRGQAVTVVAERPVIQPDVAGSEMVMREEDVAVFKQDFFQDFMESQVGIFMNSGLDYGPDEEEGTGLSIRGGDINEVDVSVNGVSLNNAITQQPNLGISLTSIQEVTITTGGFTAEYGNVRSGQVNVISKEGSRDHFNLSLDARVGPPQMKHFGPNPYSVNGPIWNVYCGEKAYQGVTADDVAAGDYPFEFIGWNKMAERALNDGDPENDYTPQQWMELWRWNHKNVEYAQEPDIIIDGSLTGPFPIGNATFLLAQHFEDLQLAFPYSRKNSIQSTTQANLTFRLSPKMKMSFTNLYILQRGTATQAQDLTNGMITGTKEGTRLAREVRWHMLYNPYGVNPIEQKTFITGLKLSHQLSEKTFHNLSVTGSYYTGFQGVETHRDTTKTLVGTALVDPGPDTGFLHRGQYYDMMDQFWIYGGGRQIDDSDYWQVRAKWLLESQVTMRNLVKMGFETSYTQYHMAAAKVIYDNYIKGRYHPPDFTEGSTMSEDSRYFDDHPIQVAAFIQDKLEYEGMNANLGLRFELFNPMVPAWKINDPDDDEWYTDYTLDEWRKVDSDSNFINVGFKDQLEEKNAVAYRFSPRLGIAFPTTATSKFYFNYGHFYQLPLPNQLFAIGMGDSDSPFRIPNLNAEWPRTVMYEVGFEKAFPLAILFRISAYYKDVTNQLSTDHGDVDYGGVKFYDFDRNEVYSTEANNSYEDIRGIELRLHKRHGRFGYGWIDFEYISTSEGWTGFQELHKNWQYEQEQREDAEQVKNWPVPRVSMVYSFLLPEDFGPGILGFKPLSSWALQINAWWEQGGRRLFGDEDNPPPIWARHYVKRIDRHNVDLVLRKGLNVGNMDFSIYMRVRNATNFKGRVYPFDGEQYRSSLHLPWLPGDMKGNDLYGEGPSDDKPWIDAGWQTWKQYVNPRYIMFGLDLNI